MRMLISTQIALIIAFDAHAYRSARSDITQHPTSDALSIVEGEPLYLSGPREHQVPLHPDSGSSTAAKGPTERALLALSTLQEWYNGFGLWDTTGWWNSANILTTIGNLAQADPRNSLLRIQVARVFSYTARHAPVKNPQPFIEYRNMSAFTTNSAKKQTGYKKTLSPLTFEIHTSYPTNWFTEARNQLTTGVLNSNKPVEDSAVPISLSPHDWLDGYYDDDLWWALAWITAYDVTRHDPYLRLAEGIFHAVSKTWPTHCNNGGIYWSWERNYVNAIPNELYISTAAHLANRVGDSRKWYYVDWAERGLRWFLSTGMVNKEGTINDGLTNDKCKNNGQPAWSYNQGVILGALVELNKVAPKLTYLPLAHKIAQAALRILSDADGVIHDVCEPDCGADGTQFKGVFMRNLVQLNKAEPRTVYEKSIRINAASIWLNDRGEDGVLSVDWAGPFIPPGNASTHSSAMDVLVANILIGK